MATLRVLKCKTCGRPLKAGLTKCACGTENIIVPEEVNPLKMSADMAKQYLEFFQQQKEENPKDTNALYAMGLFYLGLQNYELAQRNFKEAIDLSPQEPDVYYYFALSLAQGKTAKEIEHNVAIRLEEYLLSAIKICAKRKYLALLMFIRQGAFLGNGLQCQGESPSELLKQVKATMPESSDEIDEITTHLRITDNQNKLFLKELRGEEVSKSKETIYFKNYHLNGYICPACGENSLDSDESGKLFCGQCSHHFPTPPLNKLDAFVCLYPTQRDYTLTDKMAGVKTLERVDARRDFLANLWEPKLPDKLSKPAYPVGNLLKRLIFTLVASFILLMIEGIVGFGTGERRFEEPKSVNAHYNELYAKATMNKADRAAAIEELTKDSIQNQQADIAFLEEYWIINHRRIIDGVEQELVWAKPEQMSRPIELSGLRKGWKGPLTLLILLWPMLLFIFTTIKRFKEAAQERRLVEQQNKENKRWYEDSLQKYNNRPTIQDMSLFCQLYLGKEGKEANGDPVATALRQNDISETDLAGKILFLNYFDYEDEEQEETIQPEYVLDRIYYTIAIPQKDRVTILENYWDTRYNEFGKCDTLSLFYKNITSLSLKEDSITIQLVGGNEKSISLPPYKRENLLHYQSEVPQDQNCFSITRTGNPKEFVAAMEKLVSSYQR